MRQDFVIDNTKNDTQVVIISQRISLEQAQDFCEGFVHLLTMNDSSQFVCNEDGRKKDGKKLEVNDAAPAILKARKLYAVPIDGVRGNVLIFKNQARWL